MHSIKVDYCYYCALFAEVGNEKTTKLCLFGGRYIHVASLTLESGRSVSRCWTPCLSLLILFSDLSALKLSSSEIIISTYCILFVEVWWNWWSQKKTAHVPGTHPVTSWDSFYFRLQLKIRKMGFWQSVPSHIVRFRHICCGWSQWRSVGFLEKLPAKARRWFVKRRLVGICLTALFDNEDH